MSKDLCNTGCCRWTCCSLSPQHQSNCPCMQCLIKARCSQTCKDRQDYWDKKEYKLRLDQVSFWKMIKDKRS